MKGRVTLRVESLDNRIIPSGAGAGGWAQVVPSIVPSGHGDEVAHLSGEVTPSVVG
jgi:hypothetical protein